MTTVTFINYVYNWEVYNDQKQTHTAYNEYYRKLISYHTFWDYKKNKPDLTTVSFCSLYICAHRWQLLNRSDDWTHVLDAFM